MLYHAAGNEVVSRPFGHTIRTGELDKARPLTDSRDVSTFVTDFRDFSTFARHFTQRYLARVAVDDADVCTSQRTSHVDLFHVLCWVVAQLDRGSLQ